MARENDLNAGHSLAFTGRWDSKQKCGTVPQYAGRLASMKLVEQTERGGYGHVDPRSGLTPTYTGRTQGKGRLQARGSTSSGLHPHVHVEHTENGGYRHVNPRQGAYTHVNRSNTRKRAATGRWIHIQGPTPTSTFRTHGQGRLQARGSTSRGLHPRA